MEYINSNGREAVITPWCASCWQLIKSFMGETWWPNTWKIFRGRIVDRGFSSIANCNALTDLSVVFHYFDRIIFLLEGEDSTGRYVLWKKIH